LPNDTKVVRVLIREKPKSKVKKLDPFYSDGLCAILKESEVKEELFKSDVEAVGSF